MHQDKYSLWIVPKGQAGKSLDSLITKLAQENDSVSFVPHLTLVAGLMASSVGSESLKHSVSKLAQSLGEFSVSLLEYGYKEEEYRCLYLLAEPTKLNRVYELAADIFPQVKSEHFSSMPHLSVLYGDYAEAAKQRIIDQNPVNAIRFNVSELSLFQTNGSANNWHLVQEFPIT